MRIILARHGETDYNKNKMVQGHTDIPLNEEGIRQGIAAGKKIGLYTKSGAWKNSSPRFQFLYTKRQIFNIIKV